jgi:hypothetical protein
MTYKQPQNGRGFSGRGVLVTFVDFHGGSDRLTVGPFPSATFTYGQLRVATPDESDWLDIADLGLNASMMTASPQDGAYTDRAHPGAALRPSPGCDGWWFAGRLWSDMDIDGVAVASKSDYVHPDQAAKTAVKG